MLTIDSVTQYALDVLDGQEVAGPYVRAACRRHMADRERSDIWFDRDAADRLFRFFETRLFLNEGQFEGKPFRLHPSQKFIVGSIFGWKRPPDGEPGAPRSLWVRRFQRAYLEMGKGAGKSPLAGGIGLYGLLYDDEPGAQIYSAGADRNQSDILFQDAVKMAQASPQIWKLITPAGTQKTTNIAAHGRRQRGSFFRPLARTAAKSGSGPRPHMALCDELHEHPNGDVAEFLERGFKFRRQPLLLMITNSGSDRNTFCWQEREHAVAVVLGDTQDDRTFSYVCALDEGDDPLEDPACWKKANPLLGVTLTHEYLSGVVQQARAQRAKRNKILRLHFCVWTDAETAWIPREDWEACEDPKMRIDEFDGRPCRVGLDLASRRDILGKAILFEDGTVERDGEVLPTFALFAHGYTPADDLQERIKRDKARYDLWVEDGYLTPTPGPSVRFSQVIADLVDDQARFDLVAVAYDRYLWRRFEEDAGELGAEFPVVEHPQGFARRQDTDLWMPGSIDALEDLVAERRIRIQVNPALRSAVAGATFIESQSGLKRIDKARATQRIDLLVAAVMAVGAACSSGDDGESVYEMVARERRTRHTPDARPPAGRPDDWFDDEEEDDL